MPKSTHAGRKRFERLLGLLLRTGVLLAAAVVLLGGALYLVQHATDAQDRKVFHSEPATLRHIGGIVMGAMHLHGRALIQLGLLLLVVTPVARVAFSVVDFLRRRDLTYVVLTLVVLSVLLFSFFFGEKL